MGDDEGDVSSRVVRPGPGKGVEGKGVEGRGMRSKEGSRARRNETTEVVDGGHLAGGRKQWWSFLG